MAYSNYGTGIYNIKPSGENILEQAYNPLSNYISGRLDAASLAREAVRQNGMKYTWHPVQPVQTNPLAVFTGPNARLYDAATGRLKPGVSQEAMGGGVSSFADFNSSITNNVPDFFKGYLGINGFPYVGGLDNPAAMPAVTSNTGSRPSVFSNNQQTDTVATTAPTHKEFSLSPVVQQQVQQPQQRPVQVQTATADVQPTTSQPISPIGLQSVTGAMNAKSTAGNPIPQSANTEGWFGTAKSWLGDIFGVDATQYLTNPDGTIMKSKEGVPIVNADATSWGDVGAGLMGTAQIGLGAYNMFTGLDQQQQALDTKRGELDLLREKYAEDKRKNQAIVAQNRGA